MMRIVEIVVENNADSENSVNNVIEMNADNANSANSDRNDCR